MSEASLSEWIDEVADRFEAEWRGTGAPRIAAFLPPAGDERRAALLAELVRLDLEYRHKLGPVPPLDDYLSEFPELADAGRGPPTDLVRHYERLAQNGAEVPLDCPHCGQPIRIVGPSAPLVTCESCGSTFRLSAERQLTRAAAVPKTLGKFEILELLGEGSFGAVHRARDTQLDRFVAIKIPRDGCFATDGERERFLREARAAAQLRHPGIVPIHEIGQEGPLAYIVSEFIDGETLAARIKRKRPTPREAAELVRQIALALQYAHEQKLIHRDIKPANILLDRAGQPHLADFGLARREGAEVLITLAGQILGTPAYMSPELARGDVGRLDARADVYSLGIVLYELLTGERPFRGSTRMLLYQVLHDEPRSPRRLNDRIPRDLETICLKCLEKNPARRYASAADLAEDLQRFLTGLPVAALPVSGLERASRWCGRNPAVAGLSSALVLSLLAGAVVGVVLAFLANRRATDAEHARRDEAAQARVARAQKAEADAARESADAAKERVERLRYANLIRIAQQEWELGNARAAHRVLHECRAEFRGWEYDYLWNLFRRGETILLTHENRLVGLGFTHDGKQLLSASQKGMVKIWNMEIGEQSLETRQLVNHESGLVAGSYFAVRCVAFSPDGTLAASASGKSLKVWRVHTGDVLHMLDQTQPIECLAFGPDGARLAAGGKNLVKIWDVHSGASLWTLPTPGQRNNFVSFSADGAWLASASQDDVNPFGKAGQVTIWNATNGEATVSFGGQLNCAFSAVAFDPAGDFLASSGSDNVVRLWNPRTGNALWSLSGHERAITCLAVSPDGQRLASGGLDATVRLWDVATGRLLQRRGLLDKPDWLAFSPDGAVLAIACDSAVHAWDLAASEPTVLRGHSEAVICLDFSPDGQWLVTGGDTTLKIWDAASGRERDTLRGHPGNIRDACYSPDGKLIASGSFDRTLRIWNAASGEPVHVLGENAGDIECVTFDPAGQRIAGGLRTYPALRGQAPVEIKLWNVESGKFLRALVGHGDAVNDVTFSRDGKTLLSASSDRTIKLWNADTGDEIRTLRGHELAVVCARFDRTGRRIVSASRNAEALVRDGLPGEILVWNAETGDTTLTLRGHTDQVTGVCFSPDGSRIASASADQTLKLWDAQLGHEVLTLRGHARGLTTVAFSPDGRQLVSGSFDKTARIWDGTPSSPPAKQ